MIFFGRSLFTESSLICRSFLACSYTNNVVSNAQSQYAAKQFTPCVHTHTTIFAAQICRQTHICNTLQHTYTMYTHTQTRMCNTLQHITPFIHTHAVYTRMCRQTRMCNTLQHTSRQIHTHTHVFYTTDVQANAHLQHTAAHHTNYTHNLYTHAVYTANVQANAHVQHSETHIAPNLHTHTHSTLQMCRQTRI